MFSLIPWLVLGCHSFHRPEREPSAKPSQVSPVCNSITADIDWMNHLPVETSDVRRWALNLPHAVRHSGTDPTTDEKLNSGLMLLMSSIWSKDPQTIKETANAIGFSVKVAHLGSKSVLLIHELPLTGRHAVVLVNPFPERDLVIEIPHGSFEAGTLPEGLDLFAQSGARALIIAGADRCASSTTSVCDGKTAVCGEGDDFNGTLKSYPTSDVAHSLSNAFHTIHINMASRWPHARFIQFHGMKPGPTSVILSDGSKSFSAETVTWSNEVRNVLRRKLGHELSRVTSCQSAQDSADYNFRRLCGLDNVQGRVLNLSPDACRVGADNGTGRFLHVEQSMEMLDSQDSRKLVIDSIMETLEAPMSCPNLPME